MLIYISQITACIPPIRPLISTTFPSLSNAFARFTERFNRRQSFIYNPVKRGKTGDTFTNGASEVTKYNRYFPGHSPQEKTRNPWQILTRQSVEVRRDTLPRNLEKPIGWKKSNWEETEQREFTDESDSLDYTPTNSPDRPSRRRLQARRNSNAPSEPSFGKGLLTRWFSSKPNSSYRDGDGFSNGMMISNPLRYPDPVRNASQQRIDAYGASNSQLRLPYPPQEHPSLAWPRSTSRPYTAPPQSKRQVRSSPSIQRVEITKNPFIHVDKSRLVARDEVFARGSRATFISDDFL
jgi:hypothetical protein